MIYLIKNYKVTVDDYIKKYGKHFNDKLCTYAASFMKTKGPNNTIKNLTMWDKIKVDLVLQNNGIVLKNNYLWDYIYVANMCAADFLGNSVVDDRHLALYIKDTIDDVDGEEGTVFCRWLADVKNKDMKIDWELML